MQVKFNKRLEDYQYILAFDPAKHKTGFSLVNFKEKKIPYSGVIITKPNTEMPWGDFYSQLEARVKDIQKDFGSSFFVCKERLPNQAGARSSIAALQGLAMAHAVLDLFIFQHNIDYYDWMGVHSIAVKAHFKGLSGLEKPQKEDIFAVVRDLYPSWEVPEDNELSYDVSDAVAVAETLVEKKWDADLSEEIKCLKKELKTTKAKKKINQLEERIQYLQNLKRG